MRTHKKKFRDEVAARESLKCARKIGAIKRRQQAAKKTRPCKRCVAAGKYDNAKPHSSVRSKVCFFHKPNKKTEVKNLFGDNISYYVVKAGLDHSLRLSDDDKEKFHTDVNNLVENVREVAIKSQLFATHYILHWLETKACVFYSSFFLQIHAIGVCKKCILCGRCEGPIRDIQKTAFQYCRYEAGVHASSLLIRDDVSHYADQLCY